MLCSVHGSRKAMFWMLFMQDKNQVHYIYSVVKKWLTILSCAYLVSACDNKPPQSTPPEVQVKPANTETSVIQNPPLHVQFQIEPLIIKDERCAGQICPEIKIHRIKSNFAALDLAVDNYVYGYMSGFLKGIDLPPSPNEVVQPAAQSQTPLQQLQQNQIQTKTTNTVKDEQQQEKEILLQQINPYIDKFIRLAAEVKSLGSSSQLSVYIKPQVLNPAGPVSTVVINANNYIGGAHGSSAQQYINFELDSKKILNIEHILQAGQRKALNDVVHQKFQNWVKESQPEMEFKLYENLWNFKLSDNFYLSPQGLIFQYAEYEIGPYAVGLPRLTVPYAELQTIVKPQYLPVITKDKPRPAAAQKTVPTS